MVVESGEVSVIGGVGEINEEDEKGEVSHFGETG